MNRISYARILVATSALLSLASCDALFGGLAKGNPESCVATPSICNADTEICNAVTRECEPALRIDSISPSAAPYDTAVSVTLTGKNFVPDMQFLIDGKPATSVVFQSDTSLTATVPASSGNKALVPGELITPTMQRLRREGLFHYFPWPQFSIPSNQPLSGFIKTVRSGDVNGDGRPDIVVAADNSAGVAIFMGQSDGTLAASAPAVFSSRPFFVAIGDA